MSKKRKGFTLIELLIVIAIIGTLAAMLVPVFLSSIQKAKQKGTMQHMNGIAGAILDYITDIGSAPEQSGAMVAGSSFLEDLTPFYMKAMPLIDQWGTAFYVYCGTDVLSAAGIGGVTGAGPDDFIVISYGRDRISTSFSFDPLNPATCFFELTSLASYDQDLIIWSGSWIHAPKTAQVERH